MLRRHRRDITYVFRGPLVSGGAHISEAIYPCELQPYCGCNSSCVLVTRWHRFAHISHIVQTQRNDLSNRFSIRPYKMVRIASIKGGEIGTPKW